MNYNSLNTFLALRLSPPRQIQNSTRIESLPVLLLPLPDPSLPLSLITTPIKYKSKIILLNGLLFALVL
jgi:hypothetical protein